MRIGIALAESLVNALCHGNLEVGSELRGVDDDAYYSLLAQRRACAPYCDRRIHIDSTFSRKEARFVIRDERPASTGIASRPDRSGHLEKAAGPGACCYAVLHDSVSLQPQRHRYPGKGVRVHNTAVGSRRQAWETRPRRKLLVLHVASKHVATRGNRSSMISQPCSRCRRPPP